MNRIQRFAQTKHVSSPHHRTPTKALLLGSRLNAVTDWKAVARKGDYSVSSIAIVCGVSERQLRRYIQAKFNQSPRVWLEDLRLAEAEALLIRREPIKVIVDILHFNHRSHFGRAFKRKYDVTPGQYLIRHQLKASMSETVHDVRWC